MAEIELPKDEDNVTSLAVGVRSGKTNFIFAGANSNLDGAKKGKNAHLRVLRIDAQKPGKGSSAQGKEKITEVSRTALFSGTDKDIYQRITRLSNPVPNQVQLGAVTNGLSQGTETILFNASATPSSKPRAILTTEKETEDVDILQTGTDDYLVAYCTQHDVYLKKISWKGNEEPRCVYVTPFSKSHEKPTVPKFRALRWLTKDFILMLTNIHSTGGVVLQVLRLPPSGKGQCRIIESHRLPDHIKKATGLAVANLTPPPVPKTGAGSATVEQGYTQFVIAVAGQDSSISLFKADLQVEQKVPLLSKIKPFRTFKSVHPMAVTCLAFSHFTPPREPITASTPPQVLKLASVSVQQTVAVHTIPLFLVPLSMQRGQSKTPRYVVALPSKAAGRTIGLIISILGAVLLAIFAQGVLELRGSNTNLLNAKQYIPTAWQDAVGIPRVIVPKIIPNEPLGAPLDTAPEVSSLPQILEDLEDEDGQPVVVIKDTSHKDGNLKVKIHDEETHGPASGKPWVELNSKQRAAWKKKLTDAGHWAEDMGETILKGVLFGELAGAVGHAVAG